MVGYVSKKAMARERTYMDVVGDAIDLTTEYMDDCSYSKVDQLEAEDLDYIASELQIGLADLQLILTEHMGYKNV